MPNLCPCAAQPDRSQVLSDSPSKRKCLWCEKVFDAPNPEHAAARPAPRPAPVSEDE